MSTQLDLRQAELRPAAPMIGSTANETADSVLTKVDGKLAKLFEDRNALLTDGGEITFSGTAISFTEALNISINSQVAGSSPTIISLGSGSQSLNDGDMWYAVIDRVAGTATTAVASSAGGLPAASSANQEVFLIAKRVDAGDATTRLYWRNGWSMSGGTTARLSESTGGSPTPTPSGNCPTYEELIAFQLFGTYNATDYQVRLQNKLTSFPTGNCPCG